MSHIECSIVEYGKILQTQNRSKIICIRKDENNLCNVITFDNVDAVLQFMKDKYSVNYSTKNFPRCHFEKDEESNMIIDIRYYPSGGYKSFGVNYYYFYDETIYLEIKKLLPAIVWEY